MNFQLILILIFGFASAVLLVFSLWPRRTPDVKAIYGSYKERQGTLLLVSPLLAKLASYNGRIKKDRVVNYRAQIKQKLTSAGDTSGLTPDEFIGIQEISMILVPIVGIWLIYNLGILDFLVKGGMSFLTCLLLIIGGFYFPVLSLNGRTAKRHKVITRSLPYALDLITVAVEAGLDFGAAVGRLVDKAKRGALTEEFFLMLQQIRMGKTRRDALRDMAKRVDLPDLASIVASLVQADELGTSLGPILRIQSDQLRTKRTQRAEKLAAEAPVKMLIPLLGCIFPAVFVMLFGPIILQFMKGGF